MLSTHTKHYISISHRASPAICDRTVLANPSSCRSYYGESCFLCPHLHASRAVDRQTELYVQTRCLVIRISGTVLSSSLC